MRCPVCGTKAPTAIPVCVTCWTPLPVSGARATITSASVTPRQRDGPRSRRTLTMALTVIAIGLAAALIYGQPWARAGLPSTAPRVGGVSGAGSWPTAPTPLSPYAMVVAGNDHLLIDDRVHHIVLLSNLSHGPAILYGRVSIPGYPIIVAGSGVPGDTGDGGPARQARLDAPGQMAVDPAGNLFIADTGNKRIRRVDAMTGIITTVVGNMATSGYPTFGGDSGPAIQATFRTPTGITMDGAGNLYIADTSKHRVRKVAVNTGVMTTIVGPTIPPS